MRTRIWVMPEVACTGEDDTAAFPCEVAGG